MKHITVNSKKCVFLNGDIYDYEYMTHVMDNELREMIHNERDWDGDCQAFAERYYEAHEKKYGEKDAETWLEEANYKVIR